MSSVTAQSIKSKKIWEDFLSNWPTASFLQSWYWGDFQENIGHEVRRVGFYADAKLIGVALSVVEKAKRGTYMTVAGGPTINWSDQLLVTACLNELKQQARDTGCSFIRIRPQLEETTESVAMFEALGLRRSPMHLGAELTHQLDCTQSEQELLSNMRKSTRYEIRKAIKLGIQVESTASQEAIVDFYKLQLQTAERQHFTPFSLEFLQQQFVVFAQAGNALLYTASLQGELLAQAFILFYGEEAVYHYGASTEAGRKFPGAYAVQWQAILEAKQRGMKRYNFWGVADDPNHRYYSLSMFKRGFGGYDYSYLHAHDLVIDHLRYSANFAVESVRKKMRRL